MAARRPASKRARHDASQEYGEEVAATLRLVRRMPPAGFPKSKRVRMRYATTFLLNPTTDGVPVHKVLCANGMFDPEHALGGHQPMGFDQWMTVYDHFTVTDSVVQVKPLYTSPTSVQPGVFGVTLDDDHNLPYGSLTDMIESGMTSRRTKVYGLTEAVGTGSDPLVYKAFRAKKFFGIKAVVGEDELKGSQASNPSEGAFFHVWACSPGAGSDPSAMVFQAVIDYVAVLTEPKALPSS